jgi:chorismate mutase
LSFPKILFPNNINANPSILSFYTRAIVPRITHRATLALAAQKRALGIVGDDEFEDDGNYGSSATLDIEVLQSISKRVHYGEFFTLSPPMPQRLPNPELNRTTLLVSLISGKFVSESKFMSDPAAFIPHIIKPNREALEKLITKPEVERKLLIRLQKKAATYAQDVQVNPDADLANGNAVVNGGGKPSGASAKIDVDGVVDLYESYIIPLTKEVEVSAEYDVGVKRSIDVR